MHKVHNGTLPKLIIIGYFTLDNVLNNMFMTTMIKLDFSRFD